MRTQTTTVALYARVSTDEQAERGTIQDQRDFLRK
jgi:DNA invertase Pin-like site-specific DNA recombinase